MSSATSRRVHPLGRVVSAAEAGLYRDAVSAREALEHYAAVQRDVLRQTAEAAVEKEREKLKIQAAMDAVRAEAAFAARTAAEIASLKDALAAAISAGVENVIGSLGLDEAISRAAQVAVASLKERAQLTIRVAPNRLDGVRARLAPLPPGCAVVADAELEDDGCVIEAPGGFVEAGLSAQVDRIRTLFATYAP